MKNRIILFFLGFFFVSCNQHKNGKALHIKPYANEKDMASCVLQYPDGRLIPAGVAHFFMVNDTIKRIDLTLTLGELKNCTLYLEDGDCDTDFNINIDTNRYFKVKYPVTINLKKNEPTLISANLRNLNYITGSNDNINTKRLILVHDKKTIACGAIVSSVVNITM